MKRDQSGARLLRGTLVLLVFLLNFVSVPSASGAEPPNLAETRRLAEQGDAKAQFNLGVMYADGNGVPQDAAQAVEWYRKAAEQGYAQAQFALGVMYAEGEGVPKDAAQAVEWYRKAAEQGDGQAQRILGYRYYNGDGVPIDYILAYVWTYLSAAQGWADAERQMNDLEGYITSTEKIKAQELISVYADRIKKNQ